MLRSLDPGLQVSGRVEVLALVTRAAALDVVHADDDGVLAAVHHGRFHGVRVAAVVLAPGAVAPLELTAYLREGGNGEDWNSIQRRWFMKQPQDPDEHVSSAFIYS